MKILTLVAGWARVDWGWGWEKASLVGVGWEGVEMEWAGTAREELEMKEMDLEVVKGKEMGWVDSGWVGLG